MAVSAEDVARADRIVQIFAPVRFELPAPTETRLRAMSDYMRSSPKSTGHLATCRGKDWLTAMSEQIFGAFREGLVAVHYHLARITAIERSITEIANAHRDELFIDGNVLVGFFCRPLNTEYQAFKFAVRRTLEYLAGAAAMYFKTEGNRIRKLGVTIDGREPRDRSRSVQARLAASNLIDVIGADNEKSVRDVLAHYASVHAGAVNIHAGPDRTVLVRLVGGGEEFQPFGEPKTSSLSAILPREVTWLEDLAFGVFGDLGLLPDS